MMADYNRQILHGNALEKLKLLEDNSVDLLLTDPPYGYFFMNKKWDKEVVGVDIWKECIRVLKPGSWAFIMCSPRQDVLSRIIVNLSDAGFKTDFTSIYWAYATGFPKAANTSKLVDKKLGLEPIKTTPKNYDAPDFSEDQFTKQGSMMQTHETSVRTQVYNTISNSEQAKKLDGSYLGFQPKPALEVILVCMKPLSEKNYTEQAMSNGKGITWLDDCRIPFNSPPNPVKSDFSPRITKITNDNTPEYNPDDRGRFPANLLVSDNALNYDEDNFSRYFDLDTWAQFIITPKPSKSEKNKGLDSFMKNTDQYDGKFPCSKKLSTVGDGRKTPIDNPFQRGKTERQNTHPTVKPISLFKYLITMGSRTWDMILDPFIGSGTSAIACEQIARNWIGIEINQEYIDIAKSRLDMYIRQERMA